MERKFKRKTEQKPLGQIGDRNTKPRDIDLGTETIKEKQEKSK